MIYGFATPEGTRRYCRRKKLPPASHRQCQGLQLSTLAIGTYGKEHNAKIADCQKKAIIQGLGSCCNVMDTAPNYFDGEAEWAVVRALEFCIASGLIRRDEVFIATKAGLAPESELAAAGGFCNFGKTWLADSIKRSLARLNLECVDCVFLHNPELLRRENPDAFEDRFAEIAQTMEEMAEEGYLRNWGVSSWSGFRSPSNSPEFLDIFELRKSDAPHLRFLQFPFGLWAPEVLTENYRDGKNFTQAASEFGLSGNAPCCRGKLSRHLKKPA